MRITKPDINSGATTISSSQAAIFPLLYVTALRNDTLDWRVSCMNDYKSSQMAPVVSSCDRHNQELEFHDLRYVEYYPEPDCIDTKWHPRPEPCEGPFKVAVDFRGIARRSKINFDLSGWDGGFLVAQIT